jgi:hypothetical protein
MPLKVDMEPLAPGVTRSLSSLINEAFTDPLMT